MKKVCYCYVITIVDEKCLLLLIYKSTKPVINSSDCLTLTQTFDIIIIIYNCLRNIMEIRHIIAKNKLIY